MMLPANAIQTTVGLETLLSDIRGRLILHSRNESRPDDADEIFIWTERLCSGSELTNLPEERNLALRLAESIHELRKNSRNTSIDLVRSALDRLTELEAVVLSISRQNEPFELDIAEFIEASFGGLMPTKNGTTFREPTDDLTGFDIDAELLEIFSAEADELLGRIEESLDRLSADPADVAALWEIRRNAHTFKGAAGVVGLGAASKVAHRIEDLLDRFAEKEAGSGLLIVELLKKAATYLRSITTPDSEQPGDENLALLHRSFDAALSRIGGEDHKPPQVDRHPASAIDPLPETKGNVEEHARSGNRKRSIIRVPIEKLDDLQKALDDLGSASAAIHCQILNRDRERVEPDVSSLLTGHSGLQMLFDRQNRDIESLRNALLRIRMVEFGTIKTRLQRTARVTADEIGRVVELSLTNETAEIDTVILDLLSEPMLHLVRNAVVHGIETSEIRRLLSKSETGQITVAFAKGPTQVVLTVSDDGAGIAASRLKEKAVSSGILARSKAESLSEQEALRLIFEPGLTTAEKLSMSAGRGVGMSIVKAGIEAVGGTIDIDTKLQSGTRFTICVPLKASEPAISDYHKETRVSTILIVDDSPSVRHLTATMVRNAGRHPVTARDGVEALNLIANCGEPPTMIVTDIEMPRMDGFELIRSLKANTAAAGIPIVVTTTLAGAEHRAKAERLGIVKFLSKPINERDLAETIRAFS